MVAPRTPPKLAILDPGKGAPRYHGALTGSVVAHVLVLFLALYDFSCADALGEPGARAGGPGARGGGGGGGGEVVNYVQLPEYVPPEAEATATPEQQVPPDQIAVVIPRFDLADIPQSDVALRDRRINLSEVLGSGDGTGGGAGQGTGTGGGIGSGIGTGTGSDVGPGTGGDGGDIFPPSPRFTVLPPTPVPGNSKGRYRIRFLVAADGSVRQIDLFPIVRDGGYRRRLLEVLREYRFTPGTTRDGTPIETIAEVWIEL